MSEESLMSTFADWLDGALVRALRFEVVAFNVNIYEGAHSWDFEILWPETVA